jgi:hypothetical protein
MEIQSNRQRDIDEPKAEVIGYDRIVFTFEANFRVRSKDIPEMQRTLLEWGAKWDVNI